MAELLRSFLAQRAYSAAILCCLVLAASLAAVFRIPVEVMPKEQQEPFLFVRVNAERPGPVLSVERALAIPVEGVLKALPRVKKLEANSDERGVSFLITFQAGTDVELSAFRLQEELQELAENGVFLTQNLSVSRFNPEAAAVVRLSVRPEEFSDRTRALLVNELIPALEEIPEVVNVELGDFDTPAHAFRLDFGRFSALGRSAGELKGRAMPAQVRESLGVIEQSSGARRLVTSTQAAPSLGEYLRLPLLEGGGSAIGALARHELLPPMQGRVANVDGERSAFLEIFQREGTNIFRLRSGLEEKLRRLRSRPEFLPIRISPVIDKSAEVQQAVGDVFSSLFQSVAVTFLVVFLFVRRLRATVLICVTVPVTLLVTVLILQLQGVSLNVLSISGLILGVGMVVDSSILMMEELTESFRAEGFSRRAAAAAAGRSAGVLLQGTLTNAVIFLPVSFVEPGDGFVDLLRSFQAPILSTFLASLFSTLFFLPMLALSAPPPVERAGAEPAAIGASCFRFLLRRRLLSVALTVLTALLLARLVAQLQETGIEQPGDAYATLQLRFGTELPAGDRLEALLDLERRLLREKGRLGIRLLLTEYSPGQPGGSFSVFPAGGGRSSDAGLRALEPALREFLAQQRLPAGVEAQLGYGGSGVSASGEKSMSLPLEGFDSEQLLALQRELKGKLSGIPGVSRVQTEEEWRGAPSLLFLPRQERLLAAGASLAGLAREISAVMGPAQFQLEPASPEGEALQGRFEILPASGRWSMEELRRLRLPLQEGRALLWHEFGSLEERSSLRRISRADALAHPQLRLFFEPGLGRQAESVARAEVRRVLGAQDFPPGTGPKTDRADPQLEAMQLSSRFVMLLSVCLIYLFLGATMESVVLPFLVILTIPLSVVFGLSGLWLSGLDLDVMARLSLVFLVGSSVNNSIILVDVIRGLRRQGYSRENSLVLGCARRFQAVLMSTSIQVIGALPVALGGEKIMGIPYASLGVCLMSGMLLSMLATFVLVPTLYSCLDSLGGAVLLKGAPPAAGFRRGEAGS